MEGNLHSVAGETMHQMRPEGRKDKMHTGQKGGPLAHHSKTLGKRGMRTVSVLQETLCFEDKMLQEVGARVTSALQKQGAGGSRHQGWLHAAEAQTLQTRWNEVNVQATKQ